MGINSKLDVSGGEVHTYGSQYKTAVDAVKPARSDLRVIMDRNLGATGTLYSLSTSNAQNYPTYGLLYQWGRKDPFPKAAAGNNAASQPTYQANGSTVTNFPTLVAGPVTISVALQNPQNFYFSTNPPHDWLSSPNTALWGDGTTKSVYDPCPEGWRIPANGTWNDFGDWKTASYGDAGFYKNSTWGTTADVEKAGGVYYGGTAGSVKAFYPAPGFRVSNTGGLANVGGGGYNWSSSIRSSQAYHLYLGTNGVMPNNGNNRSYGFSVRCIQE